MTIECTELDRQHRFATEVSWPVPGGELRCDPPGGTLLSWNCEVSVSCPAPIVGPLIGAVSGASDLDGGSNIGAGKASSDDQD